MADHLARHQNGWLKGCAVAAIVLFTFLRVDPGFESVDKRIYTHYTTSLVDDFDLNVVNQIPAKETWLLTTTRNYPDVHSNGVAVLWAPFLGIAKLLIGHDKVSERPSLYRTAQALANIFWGWLALILLWILLRRYFSANISATSLLLIVLCTPFTWYFFIQPENADMTSLFLSTALLLLYSFRSRFSPGQFAFIFGLALFSGVAVKFDAIFNGILFLHFLIEKYRSRMASIPQVVVSFSLGSTIAIAPIFMNEAIKNGFFNYAYMDTVTAQVYLLGEILFAPSGYLWTHPFYFILVIGFVFTASRARTDLEWWFYLAIPITELVTESFNYNQNETFGTRHWVNDSASFALVLGMLLGRLSAKWKKIFFVACGGSFVMSFIAALVFRFDYQAYFYSGQWIVSLSKRSLSDLTYVFSLPWLAQKAELWPMVLLAVFIISAAVVRIRQWEKHFQPRIIVIGFSVFAFAYFVATAGNILNNQKSIREVPRALLDKAVIGSGSHINSFFENAGCLQKAISYYHVRHNFKKEADRRELLNAYVEQAAQEIVRDPVNFKATLVPDRDRYLSESLWADE
jgi:hypothetical protein